MIYLLNHSTEDDYDDYDDYDEDMTQPVQASNEPPVFYLCDTMYWGDGTWIVKYSPPLEAADFLPVRLKYLL